MPLSFLTEELNKFRARKIFFEAMVIVMLDAGRNFEGMDKFALFEICGHVYTGHLDISWHSRVLQFWFWDGEVAMKMIWAHFMIFICRRLVTYILQTIYRYF